MNRDPICVSVKADRDTELRAKLEHARELGADIIETRLDYLRSLDIQRLRDLIGSQIQSSVATLRTSQAGGAFQGDNDEWSELVSRLLEMQPRFIDIELGVALDNPHILSKAQERGVGIIVSYHDFRHTPDQDILEQNLKACQDLGNLAKIVTMAYTFADNIKILQLYEQSSRGELIAFCMGDIGLVSRVLATRAGAPFTYASLPGEPTAPGQPTIDELRRVLSLVREA